MTREWANSLASFFFLVSVILAAFLGTAISSRNKAEAERDQFRSAWNREAVALELAAADNTREKAQIDALAVQRDQAFYALDTTRKYMKTLRRQLERCRQ